MLSKEVQRLNQNKGNMFSFATLEISCYPEGFYIYPNWGKPWPLKLPLNHVNL